MKNRLFLFFFFKQKTAYEMRTYWSSDVCASDLEPPDHERVGGCLRHDGAHADAENEAAEELFFVDAPPREPVEDARPFPRVPVDPWLEPVGQGAREVPEDAAAGHVGERLHVCTLAQRSDLVDVEAVRRKQEIGVEVIVAEELANQREPVRVDATGGEADHDVAGGAAGAVDHVGAVDDADAGAREVELVLLVDPRKLGRLAADQRAAGDPA